MSRTILVLNAGSSSIKFQVYEAGENDALERRIKGQLQGVGTAHARLSAKDGEDRVLVDRTIEGARAANAHDAQAVLGEWLVAHMGGPPFAVGHRVVHGGTEFAAPVLVDDRVLARLEALSPLAPL